VAEPSDFNSQIIAEFRANGGKVGGRFENATVLLLHHAGAKSGKERVNPLAYQKVGDGFAVFASKAGAPTNPDWFYNVQANPLTKVEVGTEVVEVRARVAEGTERDQIWNRQKERGPHFAGYEETAKPRVIPVVVLEPVG
jgi:deazaflavin-dependent oxidoreductase (nitroreductase family)